MTENDEYVNVNGHKDHTKSQTQTHLLFFRAKNHVHVSRDPIIIK
jgi:hypothetical protein